MTRFTDEQYAKAIAHLQDARTQLEPNGHGCHCCGDSGHQAFECGHNPLVAMAMCKGIVDRATALHDIIHALGDMPCGGPLALATIERLHEFMHTLTGASPGSSPSSAPPQHRTRWRRADRRDHRGRREHRRGARLRRVADRALGDRGDPALAGMVRGCTGASEAADHAAAVAAECE